MKLGAIVVLKFGEEAFDDQGLFIWRDTDSKAVIYKLGVT